MSLLKNKEEVVAKLHEQIDETSMQLDQLKVRIHLARADAKAALEKNITTLEEQKSNLKNQLHQLHHDTSGAWGDLAQGCQKSWEEFKTAVANAAKQFKE